MFVTWPVSAAPVLVVWTAEIYNSCSSLMRLPVTTLLLSSPTSQGWAPEPPSGAPGSYSSTTRARWSGSSSTAAPRPGICRCNLQELGELFVMHFDSQTPCNGGIQEQIAIAVGMNRLSNIVLKTKSDTVVAVSPSMAGNNSRSHNHSPFE